MEQRVLGRTGVSVSRVGLGAGGPSRLGTQRGATQADVERLIGGALDLGVTFIDTAAGYGTEAAIGAGLQALGADDEIFVATKAVPVRDGDLLSERELLESVESSLRHLRRERLDLFQFHAVRPEHYERVVHELLPVIRRRQEAGAVRFVGITENPASDHGLEMLRAATASAEWDSVMVQYGVFDQAPAATVLPQTRTHGTATLCMSAARAALVTEEMLAGVLERLDGSSPGDLRHLLTGASATWADLAFRFAAAQDDLDVIVVGTGNPDHFAQSARAVLAPLEAEAAGWLAQRFGSTDGSLLWRGDE